MWTIARQAARMRSMRTIRAQRYTSTVSLNVVNELESRGFVAALTSPQFRASVEQPTCVYSGVDPSASSLHVGNLLPLLSLLHFQAAGHQALALIGGATGSIGDPSGRSTERNALDAHQLEHNVRCITAQVHRFFERGLAYAGKRRNQAESSTTGRGTVQVLNNYEWFKEIKLLDFLRTVGRDSRVNVMLSRDSVKSRLSNESGISFTEFSYQLLQAHDFQVLHESHNCRAQIGGSDQWGNIVAGIDLIKRSSSQLKPEEEPFGLTIPLLTTSSGEKFGKSAGNAVWLDEELTGVYDFYQFFLRTTDADVGRYLRMFTFLPLEEIEKAMAEHEAQPSQRIAQRLLADEITELVHGEASVTKAHTASAVLFDKKDGLLKLKTADVLAAFDGDSRLTRVPWNKAIGSSVTKLAADCGILKSRGAAARLIRSGGFYMNDERVNDPSETLNEDDLIDGSLVIMRFGKTSHMTFFIEPKAEEPIDKDAE